MKHLLLLLMLMPGLASCQSPEAQDRVPARLAETSAATHAELKQRLAEALGQERVQIAERALLEQGVLLLERTPRSAPGGQRVPGRSLETPIRFELYLVGGRCLLVRTDSGESWPLDEARCERDDREASGDVPGSGM